MEDVLNETSDPAVGARRLLQYLASKYEKEFINEGAERGLTHKTFDNISQAASELSKYCQHYIHHLNSSHTCITYSFKTKSVDRCQSRFTSPNPNFTQTS